MGHFHATLKIASKIKSAGWEVIYGSLPHLKKDVEKHGYNFHSIPIIPVVNVGFANAGVSVWHVSRFLFGQHEQEKIDLNHKSIKEFRKEISGISPDLVLLDEQSVLKAFFYEQLDIPIIAFQTKPDTRQIKGIPPFTSFYIPKFRCFSTTYSVLLWEITTVKYYMNKARMRLFSFGQDNYSILKKILNEEGINIDNRIELRRSFCIGVKDIPRLIISPKAFDFPHSEKENVYRVGPIIDIKREGKITLPRYQVLRNKLEKEKENPGSFVIYCSLGTITAGFKNKVKKFFLKIALVASLNPDFLFILSTGNDFDINELLPAPKNLFIFNNTPQVDLLYYCHVMITHGGMNSITECVFNEVPLLIYPLSPHWDQPGNSARVVYHNLGLRGKIHKDSARAISKKLNRLKSNYNFYKNNVLTMKEKFEKENSSDGVVSIIDEITK